MVNARWFPHGAAAVLAFLAALAPWAMAEEPAPKDPPAAPEPAKDPFPELTLPAQSWLAKAEKDQWVRARITIKIDDKSQVEVIRETRVTAVETDAKGRHVTVEVANATGGNRSTSTQRFLLIEVKPGGEAAPADEEKAQPAEAVEVGGKKIDCSAGLREEKAGGKTIAVKTWRSDKVPLGNTVRIEHDGKLVYELLDFGPRR